MPKLIALVDKLPYGKKTYRRGDDFDASARDASLLVQIGRARFDTDPVANKSDLPVEVMVRASKREPITEIEPAVFTRDIANPNTDDVEVEVAVEDEAPKQKRAYRRRDMTAEYGQIGAYKPSES